MLPAAPDAVVSDPPSAALVSVPPPAVVVSVVPPPQAAIASAKRLSTATRRTCFPNVIFAPCSIRALARRAAAGLTPGRRPARYPQVLTAPWLEGERRVNVRDACASSERGPRRKVKRRRCRRQRGQRSACQPPSAGRAAPPDQQCGRRPLAACRRPAAGQTSWGPSVTDPYSEAEGTRNVRWNLEPDEGLSGWMTAGVVRVAVG